MKIRTTVLLGQKCHTTPAGLGVGPRQLLGKGSIKLEAPSFLPPRPDGDGTAEGQAASTVKTSTVSQMGVEGPPSTGSWSSVGHLITLSPRSYIYVRGGDTDLLVLGSSCIA